MILVAYYSHTGTTRRIAISMAEYLSADLCELVPGPPYADDYPERAKLEKQGGYGPKLQEPWRDSGSEGSAQHACRADGAG